MSSVPMTTATGHNPGLDGQSQAGVAIGISLGFVIVSTLVLSCRLYTRCVILKWAGPDDWTMTTAQVGERSRAPLLLCRCAGH